jgi:hypothetical protein
MVCGVVLSFLTFATIMPLDPSDTPQFYIQELRNALREQMGCIKSFEEPSQTENGAFARVTLLEGLTLVILLSLRGYAVCTRSQIYAGRPSMFSSGGWRHLSV